MFILLLIAQVFGNAYSAAVPPSIAAWQNVLKLVGNTNHLRVFVYACLLSTGVGAGFFVCCVAFAWLLSTKLGRMIVAGDIAFMGVATIFSLALFFEWERVFTSIDLTKLMKPSLT